MNQQPDKFFREKLEGVQKTASALAWEKIEAGLDKKNNKGLWLKIAAAILLLATATFLLWNSRDNSVTDQITADKPVKIEKEATPDQKLSNEQITVADNKVVVDEPVKEKPSIKSERKKRKPTTIPQENKITEDQTTVAQNETDPSDNAVNEAVTPEVLSSAETVVALESPEADTPVIQEEAVTLIYSAEEVNEKYLDKVALAKATSAQKKPSTFRKLLDKAYDLKNNQDPFGDLRQKKNEILALNFKSEKRSQNK